ncbi:MAG: hypothetical protein NLN64_02540 [Candidatus Thalassarchaeaceae archaeon]|nr:hypothetical protein [Candidatus Thalassarchaeaceae archaeon]
MESIITKIIISHYPNFKRLDNIYEITDIKIIGMVDSFPDLPRSTTGPTYIWHISNGITSINKSEIERWSVDAPSGNHLLISERGFKPELLKYLEILQNVIIWGPDKLAQWIGKAVLSGIIIPADTHGYDENLSDEIDKSSNKIFNEFESVALKPTIDIKKWLNDNSFSDVRITPVLLKCKIWFINGELKNSNGDFEEHNWKIIEDSWSNKIYEYDDNDKLEFIPSLRILEPNRMAWKGDNQIINLLVDILSEKRQGKPKLSGGMTRSMMLQNWRFNADKAELDFQYIFISAWILNLTIPTILHGINGKTYKFLN